MNTSILYVLNISKELDSNKAMASVIGGFSHGYGVYDHYGRGSWKFSPAVMYNQLWKTYNV
jgi:hypothetical protein